MRKSFLFAMLALLACVLLPSERIVSAAGPTMTILATLGSSYSEALAVNDRGQIVGSSFVGSSTSIHHAVVWNNGVPTDLGTLGGSLSVANDINASGQIVGYSTLPGDGSSHAVLWNNGAIIDLGCLPGGHHCEARSINKNGQIVGFSETASGAYHATVWQNGTIIDIDANTVGGGRALTNNNHGKIGGFSQVQDGSAVATIWKSTEPLSFTLRSNLTTILDMNNNGQKLAVRYGRNLDRYFLLDNGDGRTDLTQINGATFAPTALNDLGQVAGYLPSPSGTSVIVWQNGTVIDLGPLPGPYYSGHPNNLNNHGQVVGTISTAEGARAVLWTMP
jgi:probable HAF family extracellular repeat protein